ncbi:hypothetical protein ACJX0J_021035 [Zea mays]
MWGLFPKTISNYTYLYASVEGIIYVSTNNIMSHEGAQHRLHTEAIEAHYTYLYASVEGIIYVSIPPFKKSCMISHEGAQHRTTEGPSLSHAIAIAILVVGVGMICCMWGLFPKTFYKDIFIFLSILISMLLQKWVIQFQRVSISTFHLRYPNSKRKCPLGFY